MQSASRHGRRRNRIKKFRPLPPHFPWHRLQPLSTAQRARRRWFDKYCIDGLGLTHQALPNPKQSASQLPASCSHTHIHELAHQRLADCQALVVFAGDHVLQDDCDDQV